MPAEVTELCDLHFHDGIWAMGASADEAMDALKERYPAQCPYWLAVGLEGDDPSTWMQPTTPMGDGVFSDVFFSLHEATPEVEADAPNAGLPLPALRLLPHRPGRGGHDHVQDGLGGKRCLFVNCRK